MYAGGNLCVDIEGEPVPGSATAWWPLDGSTDPGAGSMQRVGASCAPRLSASAPAAWLRPAASARLLASGQPQSVGAALLGNPLSAPVDLAFLGAPGCMLRVSPDIVFLTGFSIPPAPDMPGDAQILLQIPSGPALLGIVLHQQWLNLQRPDARTNPAGMTLTHALVLQVTRAAPRARVVTVRSGLSRSGPVPSNGVVLPGRSPVMRFTFQ
jgi:hypothetical protein